MKITVECDYALRIVLYLSQLGKNRIADAAHIAETQKIPQRFCIKILRKLCMSNIIKSQKGVKGGYGIISDPSEINMLQIIEAIDGDIAMNKCLKHDCDCLRISKDMCPIHNELCEINDLINTRLKSITFEKLLNEVSDNTLNL